MQIILRHRLWKTGRKGGCNRYRYLATQGSSTAGIDSTVTTDLRHNLRGSFTQTTSAAGQVLEAVSILTRSASEERETLAFTVPRLRFGLVCRVLKRTLKSWDKIGCPKTKEPQPGQPPFNRKIHSSFSANTTDTVRAGRMYMTVSKAGQYRRGSLLGKA